MRSTRRHTQHSSSAVIEVINVDDTVDGPNVPPPTTSVVSSASLPAVPATACSTSTLTTSTSANDAAAGWLGYSPRAFAPTRVPMTIHPVVKRGRPEDDSTAVANNNNKSFPMESHSSSLLERLRARLCLALQTLTRESLESLVDDVQGVVLASSLANINEMGAAANRATTKALSKGAKGGQGTSKSQLQQHHKNPSTTSLLPGSHTNDGGLSALCETLFRVPPEMVWCSSPALVCCLCQDQFHVPHDICLDVYRRPEDLRKARDNISRTTDVGVGSSPSNGSGDHAGITNNRHLAKKELRVQAAVDQWCDSLAAHVMQMHTTTTSSSKTSKGALAAANTSARKTTTRVGSGATTPTRNASGLFGVHAEILASSTASDGNALPFSAATGAVEARMVAVTETVFRESLLCPMASTAWGREAPTAP